MGDSQTCHFYLAAECFLREFAPKVARRCGPGLAGWLPAWLPVCLWLPGLMSARTHGATDHCPSTATPAASEPLPIPSSVPSPFTCLACSRPFPDVINRQFSTHDPPIYPKCLQLVHGTRVCQLRVDEGRFMINHVMPLMLEHHPDFEQDLVLFNFGCAGMGQLAPAGSRAPGPQAGGCSGPGCAGLGLMAVSAASVSTARCCCCCGGLLLLPAGCRLHYGYRGRKGFRDDIELVANWRVKQGQQRPQMVWMDVPMQASCCAAWNGSRGECAGLGCGASNALPVVLPALLPPLLFSSTTLEPHSSMPSSPHPWVLPAAAL